MGRCAEIDCPKCRKTFVVSYHMIGAGMDYHCPFCDLYFKEAESPRLVK